ncbi:hypothetical protein ACWDOR_03940 [Streptosporangium canum]
MNQDQDQDDAEERCSRCRNLLDPYQGWMVCLWCWEADRSQKSLSAS